LCACWYVHSVHDPLAALRERAGKIARGDTFPRRVPSLWDRLGGISISEEEISHLRRVADAIQKRTSPDEPIFDFSNQGAHCFLADRPSVTRYHQLCYASTPALQREVIRDLECNRTRLVIYCAGDWFDSIDSIPSSERHPLIAHYLYTHYVQSADIDGTIILLRER